MPQLFDEMSFTLELCVRVFSLAAGSQLLKLWTHDAIPAPGATPTPQAEFESAAAIAAQFVP
jgi:hypothetical protein